MKRERLIPLVSRRCAAGAACSSDGSTTATDRHDAIDDGHADDLARSDDHHPGPSGRPQGFASRLEFFGDCPALLSYMQTEASARVTAWGLGGGGLYGEDRVMVEEMAEADTRDGVPRRGCTRRQGRTSRARTPRRSASTRATSSRPTVELRVRRQHRRAADRVGHRRRGGRRARTPAGCAPLLLDGERLVVVTSSWSGSPDTIVSLFDVADPTNPACCAARTSREVSSRPVRSTGWLAW
jgi:hypothetical protein